jgi:hypothetical protein
LSDKVKGEAGMNKALVYAELMKGSLKELNQLERDLEPMVEYKLNLHFKQIFQTDDTKLKSLLENCRFESGTVLSRLLNVSMDEYAFALTPGSVEISYNDIEWTINDAGITCENRLIKYGKRPDLSDQLPNDAKELAIHLWTQYKEYVNSKKYLEDERSRDSDDEDWDKFIDGMKDIIKTMS